MDDDADTRTGLGEKRLSKGLYSRYLRLLRVSRLLSAAFWTMMAFFLVWSIPWLPGGLSQDDYNGRAAATVLLAAGAFGLGAAALASREWLRRLKDALAAYDAVYDNVTGLYNRRYFYDRLNLECERAERQGVPLSVLLFRFKAHSAGRKGGSADTLLSLLAETLQRETRGMDVVAVLGGSDLAVAAPGTAKEAASQLGQRLRQGLERALVERLGVEPAGPVHLGVSEYPSEGSSAEPLLRAARASMQEHAPASGAPDQPGAKQGAETKEAA